MYVQKHTVVLLVVDGLIVGDDKIFLVVVGFTVTVVITTMGPVTGDEVVGTGFVIM